LKAEIIDGGKKLKLRGYIGVAALVVTKLGFVQTNFKVIKKPSHDSVFFYFFNFKQKGFDKSLHQSQLQNLESL
jgi:hypothetical protein